MSRSLGVYMRKSALIMDTLVGRELIADGEYMNTPEGKKRQAFLEAFVRKNRPEGVRLAAKFKPKKLDQRGGWLDRRAKRNRYMAEHNPFFNYDNNTVYLPTSKPEFLAHELGHAMNSETADRIFGRRLMHAWNGFNDGAFRHIPVLGPMPQLMGEALASIRGYRRYKDKLGLKPGEAIPRLLKAYGTYAERAVTDSVVNALLVAGGYMPIVIPNTDPEYLEQVKQYKRKRTEWDKQILAEREKRRLQENTAQ